MAQRVSNSKQQQATRETNSPGNQPVNSRQKYCLNGSPTSAVSSSVFHCGDPEESLQRRSGLSKGRACTITRGKYLVNCPNIDRADSHEQSSNWITPVNQSHKSLGRGVDLVKQMGLNGNLASDNKYLNIKQMDSAMQEMTSNNCDLATGGSSSATNSICHDIRTLNTRLQTVKSHLATGSNGNNNYKAHALAKSKPVLVRHQHQSSGMIN